MLGARASCHRRFFFFPIHSKMPSNLEQFTWVNERMKAELIQFKIEIKIAYFHDQQFAWSLPINSEVAIYYDVVYFYNQ